MASTIDPTTGAPIINNAISTNSLQGATPINIPPLVPPNYAPATNTGITQTQEALNAATLEQQAADARQQQLMGTGAIASLQMQKANQAGDTAQAYQNGGVNDLMKQLSGYNVQAQGLQREALANPLQQQNQAIGTGRVQGQVDQITAQNQRDIALRSLTLGQQAAIAQGNYDVAKSLADQQIATKYAGIDAEIAARETQLKGIQDYLVTPAEKKAASAQTALLEKQKQDIADKKAKETAINSVAMEAAKAGVTPDIQKLITSIANDPTKSVADAILAAGPSLRTPNTEVIKLGNDAAYLIDKTTGKIIKSFAGSTGGTGSGTISNPKYSGIVSTILGSGKFTKDQSAAITKAINNGDDPAAVIRNQAKGLLSGANQTKVEGYEAAKTSMQDLQSALNQYYANGGKTDIMSGNYEKVINKLGEVNDPKLVELATQIASQLQVYRNAVSGTAYSVQEGQEMSAIFPGINKTQGLNQAILNGRMKAFDSTIDGAYRSVLGNGYDQLKQAEVTGLPKGIMDDRTYVEKAVKSQSIPYQDLVNNTPSGTIPVVDNKTGEIGYVPVEEFKASQYTKL